MLAKKHWGRCAAELSAEAVTSDNLSMFDNWTYSNKLQVCRVDANGDPQIIWIRNDAHPQRCLRKGTEHREVFWKARKSWRKKVTQWRIEFLPSKDLLTSPHSAEFFKPPAVFSLRNVQSGEYLCAHGGQLTLQTDYDLWGWVPLTGSATPREMTAIMCGGAIAAAAMAGLAAYAAARHRTQLKANAAVATAASAEGVATGKAAALCASAGTAIVAADNLSITLCGDGKEKSFYVWSQAKASDEVVVDKAPEEVPAPDARQHGATHGPSSQVGAGDRAHVVCHRDQLALFDGDLAQVFDAMPDEGKDLGGFTPLRELMSNSVEICEDATLAPSDNGDFIVDDVFGVFFGKKSAFVARYQERRKAEDVRYCPPEPHVDTPWFAGAELRCIVPIPVLGKKPYHERQRFALCCESGRRTLVFQTIGVIQAGRMYGNIRSEMLFLFTSPEAGGPVRLKVIGLKPGGIFVRNAVDGMHEAFEDFRAAGLEVLEAWQRPGGFRTAGMEVLEAWKLPILKMPETVDRITSSALQGVVMRVVSRSPDC